MNAAVNMQKLRAGLAEQATPRAVIGLVLLGACLAYVALSGLINAVAEQRSSAEELQRELALSRATAADASWAERATANEAARDALEAKFWRGETAGIVAAQIQTVLEQAVRDTNMPRTRVLVQAEPTPLGANASLFEAEIRGFDEQGQFLALMRALAQQERTLTPVSFEWRRSNGATTIRFHAPALVGDAAEARS
ncbi:MAG: hypothetical protein AAFX09_10475 [Pseudomonadota bacterium]